MTRTRSTSLSVLSLVVAAGVMLAPATALAAPDHCTRGDAQAIAQAGLQFGGRALGGQPHGEPAASTRKWTDCQFRLYDDNDQDDPEVAHVFSEDDWVVGAVASFVYYSEFPLVGGTRAAATDYLDTFVDHFYFGPASTPAADLPEVPLATTSYRAMQFPGFGERAVWNHVYVIFPAGSLSPGTYTYRLESSIPDGPFAGEFESTGTIVILTSP
jgi:hypothetical protein